ncbi:MAG TPA: acetyl-CoA C-acetyltransferase [Myxococcales bacterium]|nr:acetyl-CoA C-acyltransferase [Myxococcales bacterium]HBU47182.1 acetyl-CoA C-acetyltransferase [Myxococcales bacterium]
MHEVVIVAAARTPMGSFQGALAKVPAPELGSVAIRACLQRSGVSPDQVDEVYMGMVLPAGVGQAPARQASLGAEIPRSVPCTTVNKVCGSGLKTIMLGASSIAAGENEVVVAGGMENMSLVPYLLPKARDGYRMGNGQLVDGMVHDGLWDPYNDFHMGNAGELCARECDISRERQDAFAAESYRRAQAAVESGAFEEEIAPVTLRSRKGETVVDTDEEPGRGRIDKLGALRPAFQRDGGTVTAGNASTLNDGAAAVILSSRERAEKEGWKVLATVTGQGGFAHDPEWFTTAPEGAVRAACAKAGLEPTQVDLHEINEAFSLVALVNMDKLGLDHDNVNVRGGAVALGHPIGCSGARLIVTLLHALKDEGKSTGCASLCIGGGEAVAMVVKREERWT